MTAILSGYEVLRGRVGQAAADRAMALGFVEPSGVPPLQVELFAPDPPVKQIVEQLRSFRFKGKPTIVDDSLAVPYFYNEFWTARQRQAHSIHEVSYRACFKPQLPEFFISRLTVPGDAVYDPFMGRGTTPVQAALMGRRAIGNDINPLSIHLTRPRISPPSLNTVRARLEEIDWRGRAGNAKELLVFYHPQTLAEIVALRGYLLEREASGRLDEVDDWIRMVAVNRLTGHSSGFFSVYSLPPNQAVSVQSQRRINEKRDQVPPRRMVADIILKKSASLLKDGDLPAGPPPIFNVGSADHTPAIATGSARLVVTSPPFLDVVQYASDNWLRCWFVGIDPDDVDIAMYKKPEDWTLFVSRVFEELARVVAPGGHVAFEVGEVRGGKLKLEELVLQAITRDRFDALGVVVNMQEFAKTANCWGVANNAKGTNTNRIVLARRR